MCVRGVALTPCQEQVQGWLTSPWGELPPAPQNCLCAEHSSLIAPLMYTAYAECQLHFRACQLEFLCQEGSKQSAVVSADMPAVTEP